MFVTSLRLRDDPWECSRLFLAGESGVCHAGAEVMADAGQRDGLVCLA
jgi:hypothetical protein